MFSDGELHKNPFQITDDDLTDAAPVFNLIDEDDDSLLEDVDNYVVILS